MSMHFRFVNNTKIIQRLICLLVWCQAVEMVTELTNLGQNVAINCDLDEKEIYWLLLKPPNHPVFILRLFSTSPTPFYYDLKFRPKYSVQPKHRLFIKNVTVDELGIYYCMTTEAPPKFSDGTRLHIIEPTKLPECQNHTVVKYVEQNHTVVKYIEKNHTVVKYIEKNHTVVKYIEQNHTVVNCTEQIQKPWIIVILISGLMHGVLSIVVIGVCCYSGEHLKSQEADLEQTRFMPLEQLQETKTMDTEVVFSSICEEFEQDW